MRMEGFLLARFIGEPPERILCKCSKFSIYAVKPESSCGMPRSQYASSTCMSRCRNLLVVSPSLSSSRILLSSASSILRSGFFASNSKFTSQLSSRKSPSILNLWSSPVMTCAMVYLRLPFGGSLESKRASVASMWSL